MRSTGRTMLLSGLVFWLLLACSLVSNLGAGAGPTPTANVPPGLSATQTPTPLPQSSDVTAAPPTAQAAACPQEPVVYGLQAAHHFWTPSGVGDWEWQAAGWVQVALDAQGRVTSTSTQTISGSQSGQFSSGQNSCSFTAPAEVIITVDGACAQGVVSLEIWEDWQMGTYQWTCDEDSFQFDLPSQMMPPSIHKVQYTLGDPGSYAFEIPFGGGSGSKTYTLVPVE